MKYTNPIIKGFYPDPSVCRAGDKFYLVCSSFQYMPGVPVFESDDLVNWKQVGNALTRNSQAELDEVPSSGGVFAPTIRYNNGRFYMVTANDTLRKNFYVYTDDISGEWNDPIYVDQGGIDPSLLFDEDKVYFLSNGLDDLGNWVITQCEIDIATGRKLTPSKTIWHGSGGRYLESPHMYKIGNWYYLMAAEGGTEYGHMVTYARSDDPWGEFVPYAENPVLTNRNKGGFEIQAVGHGDLIESKNGEWFIIHLAFRQIGQWDMYHHLGREVYMTPVHFDENGWFSCGYDGTTSFEYEIKNAEPQQPLKEYTLSSVNSMELLHLRRYVPENYSLTNERYLLYGTNVTIDDAGSPTFVGIRQRDMNGKLKCTIKANGGESGISVYMDEKHHYDLKLRKTNDSYFALLTLNIGCVKHDQKAIPINSDSARLTIGFDNCGYDFYVNDEHMGFAETKYLSSEVAGGFTGVLFAMFAQANGTGEFTDLSLNYNQEK